MNAFLSPKQAKEYRILHKTCRKARQADRIKAILMLNYGYSFTEVAVVLLLDDETIRKWYARYRQGGMDALLEDHHKGGLSFLTAVEQKQLSRHLRKHTYLRAFDICRYVEGKYGVCYTVKGMQALLRAMRFSYKKPKHVPGKADKQKQQQFIKDYGKLMKTKRAEDKVYFMDGVHPMHNSKPAYGWIKKGEQKQLKANTGRQRLNINGAYNIEDHKVIINEGERIDGNSVISLLQSITKKQPVGDIHVIMDNAPYNRSRLVKAFAKENRRMKLIYTNPVQ